MKNVLFLGSMFTCFLMVHSFSGWAYPEIPANEDHFMRGKRLVEDNQGDSMGRTKEGMQAAIVELKKALEAGDPNIKEIYSLLGMAYNEMIHYSRYSSNPIGSNPIEENIYKDERKKIYEKLLSLAPSDPDVLEDYVRIIPMEKAREIEIYRRIIELDPKRASARFMLGMLLIDTGSVDEGIKRVGEGIEMESRFSSIRNYVTRLTGHLSAQECPLSEEFAMNERVFWSMEMASESHDSKIREQAIVDMAKFKKEIAKKLANHKCPAKEK